jgi:hypothetical protein
VSDGEQPDQPMRRPRGRHAVPKAGAVAGDGWRARLTAVVASVEPRISSVGAWLFERRLHVLIVAATVATVAMIGGAVALISFTGGQQPDDGPATVVDADRPTSTDRGVPSSYAPILPSPSPGPPAPISPSSPAPPPEGEPADPAIDPPVEPPAEPAETEPPAPATPPGATNRPDKPKDPKASEDPNASGECDSQSLLDVLFGPPCP